jgi:ferredoxin
LGRPKFVFNILMRFWPLAKTANHLGRRPVIGPLVEPLFNPNENEMMIVPVREVVRSEASSILPPVMLETLVRKATARVVLHRCICRTAEHCTAYPHKIGCLFLGDGAKQIHPDMGRPVSTEEALEHAERAVSLGLVPLVAHANFDAMVLGIPYRRMLAICFCCDCCCSIRTGLRLGPHAFWDTVVRLPGLSVEVGDNCIGCGECESSCYVNAIRVEYGRARVSDECKGCGRCAEACPNGAISLRMDGRPETMEAFLRRLVLCKYFFLFDV